MGWEVVGTLGRDDDVRAAADDVDLLVLATPDTAIAAVASAVTPNAAAVVAHVSGARGLDVLAGHPRTAAVHPLCSLPDAEIGARRLRSGGWFAVAGDPMAEAVVGALGGRLVQVADQDRALYHAAACVASNHLVALLGQVERIATVIGVPLEAYLDLAEGSLRNVIELGPSAALTGPAARGDDETVAAHRGALAARLPAELAAYDALVAEARRLAGGRGTAR